MEALKVFSKLEGVYSQGYGCGNTSVSFPTLAVFFLIQYGYTDVVVLLLFVVVAQSDILFKKPKGPSFQIG